MRRVRIEPDMDAWLREEAGASGRSVSDIICEAVRTLREQDEGERLDRRLAGVIGAVGSGGSSSRDTGGAFADLLEEKDAQRRKRAASRRAGN